MSATDLARVLAVLQQIIHLGVGEAVPTELWLEALRVRGPILSALDQFKIEVKA